MSSLNFYILPGRPQPGFSAMENYNKAYQFYKNTWQRIFNRPGRPHQYDPMGFFRQNFIFQIQDRDKVIAQTLSTNYSLHALITEELPFFENFLGLPIEYLKENGCYSLSSLEYSAVARDYSERKYHVNLYKVIIQLGIHFAQMLRAEAVIGHPRRVTGTNELAKEIGCECIVPNRSKYGVSVDVFVGVMAKLNAYNDPVANQITRDLWRDDVI